MLFLDLAYSVLLKIGLLSHHYLLEEGERGRREEGEGERSWGIRASLLSKHDLEVVSITFTQIQDYFIWSQYVAKEAGKWSLYSERSYTE